MKGIFSISCSYLRLQSASFLLGFRCRGKRETTILSLTAILALLPSRLDLIWSLSMKFGHISFAVGLSPHACIASSSHTNVDVCFQGIGSPKFYALSSSVQLDGASLLRCALPQREHAELSVMLCSDRDIKHMNSTWRGKNVPTDVLSFPQCDQMVRYEKVLPQFLSCRLLCLSHF